jgi:hypothetical protein
MGLMVAIKLFAGVLAVAMCYVVYRNIREGRSDWHASGVTFSVERAKQPTSFWIMIAIELVLAALLLGAVFR